MDMSTIGGTPALGSLAVDAEIAPQGRRSALRYRELADASSGDESLQRVGPPRFTDPVRALAACRRPVNVQTDRAAALAPRNVAIGRGEGVGP